jgi:hypothetical protein
MRLNEAARVALAPRPSDLYATGHAVGRALERCGLSKGEMLREIACAFRAGRISHTRPAWLDDTGSHGLYAWAHAGQHVYALSPTDRSWAVLTVLMPVEGGSATILISSEEATA